MHFESLTAAESERLAYAEGYTETAKLFARIDALQCALGQAVAALEEIKTMPDRYRTGAAAEALHLIDQITEGKTE